MNAKDIWKIAAPTSNKAKAEAENARSLATDDHMRRKAPVMEQYIAMESQTMKTWNALLFPNVASPGIAGTLLELLKPPDIVKPPLSELLKPPGTVKPAAKVTVATSTAITKIKSIRPLICSKLCCSLARSKILLAPFSLKGVPADRKAQNVVNCMEICILEM